MQVFLIILCRKIMFWLLSSPFPILFLSFSYLQYNNKPKSQENASILSKNLLKMLTKGGKKLATNSQLPPHLLYSPLFTTFPHNIEFRYISYTPLYFYHFNRSQPFLLLYKTAPHLYQLISRPIILIFLHFFFYHHLHYLYA